MIQLLGLKGGGGDIICNWNTHPLIDVGTIRHCCCCVLIVFDEGMEKKLGDYLTVILINSLSLLCQMTYKT